MLFCIGGVSQVRGLSCERKLQVKSLCILSNLICLNQPWVCQSPFNGNQPYTATSLEQRLRILEEGLFLSALQHHEHLCQGWWWGELSQQRTIEDRAVGKIGVPVLNTSRICGLSTPFVGVVLTGTCGICLHPLVDCRNPQKHNQFCYVPASPRAARLPCLSKAKVALYGYLMGS